MGRQETPCASSEGGREVAPGGDLVAPDRRFGSKRNARLGPRLEKRVSKRARDVPSHRERASAARSLALSRTNSAPARSPRAGHLERARDRRDRDGPRETKSRPTGIASTRRTNPSKNPSTAWSVKHPACVPCGNARATRATKRIMVVARMVTCAATSARRKHAAEEFRCEVVFVTGGDPSRKGHPRQQRSEPEALISRRHCDLSDLSEAFPAKKNASDRHAVSNL